MYIGMVCGVHFFNIYIFFLSLKAVKLCFSSILGGGSLALVLEGGKIQHSLHLFVHMTCSCSAGKRVALCQNGIENGHV